MHLGIINASQPDTIDVSHALIAVHQNGNIRCMSQDLSQEYWNSNRETWNRVRKDGEHVVFAALLSLHQARQALLNDREDILAMLGADPDLSANSAKSLLVLVTEDRSPQAVRKGDTLCFRLFSISASLANSSNSSLSLNRRHNSIEEIASLELPSSCSSNHEDTKLFLHEHSGCLYKYSKNSLIIYNLSSLVLRVESHLDLDHEISSCLRLGPSLVVLSSSSSISVVDVRFNSLQASQPINKPFGKLNGSQVDDSTRQSPISLQLLTYFSPLEVIIGLQGRDIVSFQITGQSLTNLSSKKRIREGLLIDAIGRGMNSSSTEYKNVEKQVNIPPETQSAHFRHPKDWKDTQEKLDGYADTGDWTNFDQLMSMELEASKPIPMKFQIHNGAANGPTTESRRNRSACTVRLLISYALSKLFTVEDEQITESADANLSPKLKIVQLPPRTFCYLTQNRFMTLQLIESMLREAKRTPTSANLASNALIEALVVFDPSLKTLIQLIKAPNNLTSREIVHALSVGIRSIQEHGPQEPVRPITNSERSLHSDHDVALQVPLNIDGEWDHRLVKEATKSLYGYSESSVRKVLKQLLTRTELITFVEMLRKDLADGGWLSLCIDNAVPSESKHALENQQITTVAQLLNCAIDSLGTGGLIHSSSTSCDTGNAGDIILCMKAEVSVALEGIEEAAYLEGLLAEVLLYCKSVAQLKPEDRPFQPKKVKPTKHEPIVVPLGDELGNALPLGSKAEKPISLTKIGAGGEIQRRSRQEIAKLKSQRVGKYSFERILV